MVFAHSRNERGERHELGEHLRSVANEAAGFAGRFGGADLARWAGLAHDVGKASDLFQAYLEACEREPGKRHPTVDHKGVGTLLAAEGESAGLAFMIRGHHGGLPDHEKLRTKVKQLTNDPLVATGRRRCAELGLIPPVPSALEYPAFAESALGFDLFVRMLFSALVDADHRDTERHFDPSNAAERGGIPDLAMLWARLEAGQAALTGQRRDAVNGIRDEVYRACLAVAEKAPGFFRLTVPTGGGKTRSGLAFALRHALAHGLERVIVAVPYLTITDQTADVYRQVLGDERAVLEHHSGAVGRDDDGAATAEATWKRLATQDWDAPVIVTTTVQLFESLFGRTPAACRKLHRVARSVVILDEVQALPTNLLAPIFDVLRGLASDYGTSVVLSTATQPAFEAALARAGIGDLAVREIAPDPPRLFRTLKRVTYEWPRQEHRPTWDEIAEAMQSERQTLAIVNTKRDALALLDALPDQGAVHLSTLLCGAHRRDVLAAIRARLHNDEPCRVVSTQVVEAGVDLDFPVVFRALGPLDRVVQAAGRCNREGRLDVGRVVVFDAEGGSQPMGAYATGTSVTKTLLARGDLDVDDTATFDRYFADLFQLLPLDAKKIQPLRERLAFESVEAEFRMIEEETATVLVPYAGHEERQHTWVRAREAAMLRTALEAAARGTRPGAGRQLLRRAQPYLVSVRERAIKEYEASGLARPLVGSVWVWEGGYDAVRGIVERRGAAELVV